MRLKHYLALGILLTASQAKAAITFAIDYSQDAGGFFSGVNIGRRVYLDAAASYLTSYITATPLGAITPGGGNSWTPSVFNPGGASPSSYEPGNITVAANTIVVFAGGQELGDVTLGQGGPGGYGASGTQPFIDSIALRGGAGTSMPWGGAITFDTTANWYFDNDISTVESFGTQNDFFSVAVHELVHLLGFGGGLKWDSLLINNEGVYTFNGAASKALNGGAPVSLADMAHWSDGSALMSTSLTEGERKYLTALDLAGLSDLGYAITASPIPEPATTVMLMGVGALVVAGVVRRSRR